MRQVQQLNHRHHHTWCCRSGPDDRLQHSSPDRPGRRSQSLQTSHKPAGHPAQPLDNNFKSGIIPAIQDESQPGTITETSDKIVVCNPDKIILEVFTQDS
jgi:hypothetical protein